MSAFCIDELILGAITKIKKNPGIVTDHILENPQLFSSMNGVSIIDEKNVKDRASAIIAVVEDATLFFKIATLRIKNRRKDLENMLLEVGKDLSEGKFDPDQVMLKILDLFKEKKNDTQAN